MSWRAHSGEFGDEHSCDEANKKPDNRDDEESHDPGDRTDHEDPVRNATFSHPASRDEELQSCCRGSEDDGSKGKTPATRPSEEYPPQPNRAGDEECPGKHRKYRTDDPYQAGQANEYIKARHRDSGAEPSSKTWVKS